MCMLQYSRRVATNYGRPKLSAMAGSLVAMRGEEGFEKIPLVGASSSGYVWRRPIISTAFFGRHATLACALGGVSCRPLAVITPRWPWPFSKVQRPFQSLKHPQPSRQMRSRITGGMKCPDAFPTAANPARGAG
ncbi:hypothetical protein CNECB9_4870046 [Cupriavidus necator]|uniref:Uncharacterized protein n=1 Tax=Cupriavidus necator TaxID=106590 RepID=A0A1K0IMI9_CUPNE|nr:hypothetical protein CNECB9_4870046 [Cupriavidus necator]